MPPEAYALVTLFLVCSVLSGIAAVRIARRVGGPGRAPAYILPILAGFAAFYLVGHRFGLSIGPEIELFGFQVALLGDIVIGFGAALAVALRPGRGRPRPRAASTGGSTPETSAELSTGSARPRSASRTSAASPGSSPVATGIPDRRPVAVGARVEQWGRQARDPHRERGVARVDPRPARDHDLLPSGS